MKVKVYDTYMVIRDNEKVIDMTDELLETLDNMLTTAGVDHAFTECGDGDYNSDKGYPVYRVAYMGSDSTKFFLTYALFAVTYRGFTDDMINKGMAKHLARMNER